MPFNIGQYTDLSINVANYLAKNIIPANTIGDNGSYYQFPQDVLDPKSHSFFMILAPYSEEIKADSKGQEKVEIEVNEKPPIYLQLPTGFVDEHSQSYIEEDLILNFREMAGGGSRSQLPIAGRNTGVELGLVGNTVASGGARTLGNLITPGFRSALNGGARAAIENVYDKPNRRKWSFNFIFKARNREEEKSIRDIILALKMYKSPTYNSVAQRFPDIFDIGFASISTYDNDSSGFINVGSPSINNMVVFTKCALVNITTNYDPTGQMILTNEGHPLVIETTLNFEEVRPLDRGSIEQHMTQNDLNGSSNAYGTSTDSNGSNALTRTGTRLNNPGGNA